MPGINKHILLYSVSLAILVLVSSCSSIKPVVKNDSLQPLSGNQLSKFDGDYKIFSSDTSFRTLEFALTYSARFDLENLPEKNDRINLKAIDSRHLKVTVYKDDKVVKTKAIRGSIADDYFQFKLTHISFHFLLNGYARQTNRLGILKNGDLTLDTNGGGVILLVIMPTFGSGAELYNLVFERISGGG